MKKPKEIRDTSKSYDIKRHHHLYAAWAASRGASVKGCRFSVEQGRTILEACGFTSSFCRTEQLPVEESMDAQHRKWRVKVLEAGIAHGLPFTDGVAAKLINLYLKGRFVCGGHHTNRRVHHLHPPIDDILLKTLAASNIGGFAKEWRQARRIRWSKFSSEQYEEVIRLIRQSLNGEPLWKIEEYWRGNQ